MRDVYDFLVVGGGAAGFAVVETLVERLPESRLVLVDYEARLPYKRTKLSKLLAEGFGLEDFCRADEKWYAERNIRLLTGNKVVSIDPTAHEALFEDGSKVVYAQLVLATGARPVLPPEEAVGSLPLVFWNQTEAETLRRIWEPLPSVTVWGNGVLALELADQALALGKKVSVWSRSGSPLSRELTHEASKAIQIAMVERGVVLESPQKQRPAGLVLAWGSRPDIQLALVSRIPCRNGVLVDSRGKTEAPDVWAAGDCAEGPDGRITHLWHEAEAHGRKVAECLAGNSQTVALPPFRFKTEVFGEFAFSMNKPRDFAWNPKEETSGRLYRAFFSRDGHLDGVVTLNDKNRSKVYEKAVLERWTLERVAKELPI